MMIVTSKDLSTGKTIYSVPSQALDLEDLQALVEEATEIIQKANGSIGQNIGSRDAYLNAGEFPSPFNLG